MIALDTSACIDYLAGDSELKDLIFEQDDLLYVTSITLYEVQIGLNRTKRKISIERFNYLNKKWMEFISGIEVLPLGIKEAERAADIYDNLESKGQIIDDNDILIAGIIITNKISQIISKNVKHFRRIEELEVIGY